MKRNSLKRHSTKAVIALSAAIVAHSSLPAQSEPFRHHFGELRQYNEDWLSVCPDKLRPDSKIDYFTECWTSSFTGKPGFFLKNRLAVARNRTSGALSITFVQDKALDKRKPLFVQFTDEEGTKSTWNFRFGEDWKHRDNTINEYRFTKSDDVKRIVDKMKTSQTMTFFLPRQNSDEEVTYSLTGFNEGVAFIEKHATPEN